MSREQWPRYTQMRAAAIAAGRQQWAGLNQNARTGVV